MPSSNPSSRTSRRGVGGKAFHVTLRSISRPEVVTAPRVRLACFRNPKPCLARSRHLSSLCDVRGCPSTQLTTSTRHWRSRRRHSNARSASAELSSPVVGNPSSASRGLSPPLSSPPAFESPAPAFSRDKAACLRLSATSRSRVEADTEHWPSRLSSRACVQKSSSQKQPASPTAREVSQQKVRRPPKKAPSAGCRESSSSGG